MAARLLTHDVSDLCLGKPPVRSLPSSATIRNALATLRRRRRDSLPFLTVWTPTPSPSPLGKLSLADVACFLCSPAHLHDPCSALSLPVTSLLPTPSPLRLLHPDSSVLEALDEIADGAEILAVPMRAKAEGSFCCLTQEDIARFLLNSIGLFSPLASLPVGDLGLVRPDAAVVRHRDPGISAAEPLLAGGTAVAVVDDGGRLLGEISPAPLALCGGGFAAGALASMSAGELMAFTDRGRPSRVVAWSLKARLEERGLKGMVELVEDEEDAEDEAEEDDETLSISSCSSTLSSAANSSSSDEEAAEGRRMGRAVTSSSSYSSRMGRGSDEAIVCNRGSSLVGVMMRALAHRVGHVWVVEEEDHELAGVVVLPDILNAFRDHHLHLRLPPSLSSDPSEHHY